MKHREYDLLFFSLENLWGNIECRDMTQSPIYQEKMVVFVEDEAHCVKKWFRSPVYTAFTHLTANIWTFSFISATRGLITITIEPVVFQSLLKALGSIQKQRDFPLSVDKLRNISFPSINY